MTVFSKVKRFLFDVLTDYNDLFSNRRFAVFSSVVGIVIAFVLAPFGVVFPDNVMEALKWLGGGGTLAVAADQLRNLSNK